MGLGWPIEGDRAMELSATGRFYCTIKKPSNVGYSWEKIPNVGIEDYKKVRPILAVRVDKIHDGYGHLTGCETEFLTPNDEGTPIWVPPKCVQICF